MRAYVFTDATLARYAGRFVWLSVDIDNAANAKFISKYQTPGVPTFFVIDPKAEAVTTRYVGGFTVASLKKFLDDNGRKETSPGDQFLVIADRFATEGRHAAPAKRNQEAPPRPPTTTLPYR